MERNYAGFWIRVLANFIDGFILLIPTVLIEFLSYNMFGPSDVGYWDYQFALHPMFTAYDVVSAVLTIGLGIFYYGLWTSKYGGTPGKLMLGLRVIKEDGEMLSLGRSIGRYFAYIPSSILMIGYIMVGFSSKKQGLHDKMCKTFVVHK